MQTWSSSRTGPTSSAPEGVARAMRGFLGIETGLPSYPVKPSGITFTIDPALADYPPGARGSGHPRGLVR